MAWQDLWVALALVLVIEGLLPFLNPGRWRQMLAMVAQLDERQIRLTGLFSMFLGLGLLYLVR